MLKNYKIEEEADKMIFNPILNTHNSSNFLFDLEFEFSDKMSFGETASLIVEIKEPSVFKSLKTLKGLNEINFEGWLRKIIVHEALSFLRKNSNLIVTTTDTTYEDKDYYELVTEEDGEDIQQVIDRLPENQKIVFVLYAIEGYSHQEIAKSLHIQIGTSKSYLSRAREKLQKKLHKTYFKKNGKA